MSTERKQAKTKIAQTKTTAPPSTPPTFQRCLLSIDQVLDDEKFDDAHYNKCIKYNIPGTLFQCETCNLAFHGECIDGPIGKGNWFCESCKEEGLNVGYDSKYYLHSSKQSATIGCTVKVTEMKTHKEYLFKVSAWDGDNVEGSFCNKKSEESMTWGKKKRILIGWFSDSKDEVMI